MFCVVEKRDERARMQLQAALLKEMEYLHNSIEQSLCTFEAKIEERTPARSGEATHSRAGEAAAEDLRKELSTLREHVHRELDGLRSKVARSTPQPKKKKTVASPPGAARSEADPPVMPRRLAPWVEMRRRSSRILMRGWLRKPLALASDLSARFRKPRPGRSSLPINLQKRDAEGDGGRGP